METFIARTDEIIDYELKHNSNSKENYSLPDCDAYLLLYLNDGNVNFDIFYDDSYKNSINDLAQLISSLNSKELIQDIITELPDIHPCGEEVQELAIQYIELTDMIEDEYEDSPLVNPCDLFNQPFNKNNN